MSDATDAKETRQVSRRWRSKSGLAPVPEKGERLEEWMLTYMDTVTLLVTLFVLILSFSSISDTKYQQLIEGLRLDKYGTGIMTGSSGIMDMPAVRTPASPAADLPSELALNEADVNDRLQNAISERGLDELVDVTFLDGLIDLKLQENVLFPSGSATLIDSGIDVLKKLLPLLTPGDFRIVVEGHTDSVPISNDLFPSNWELSGARAASVVRELIDVGIEEDRLEIAGFAHTKPLTENTTNAGRAQNRRVNIVLHATPSQISDILKHSR